MMKAILVLSCTLLLCVSQAAAQKFLPSPVLYMSAMEAFEVKGVEHIRYRFDVINSDAYPAELFAASPDLPPCGKNTKSSRTWVDLFDQSGKRLHGFCALGKPEALSTIWFAIPSDIVPPSWIYIQMHDRKTDTKYKSNLAETTL